MNKYLIKIGLFLVFCIVSIVIIACSDEFVVAMAEGEELRINDSLGTISDFYVKEGFRDSTIMTIVAIINPEENLGPNDTAFGADTIIGSDVAVENNMKRILRYRVEFNQADNSSDYEVRVHRKPITEKNWNLSQVAEIEKDDASTNERFIGSILLSPRPEIMMGKCTGCGECKEKCPVDAISLESGKAIINYDKCIECGECYRACGYNSIDGVFAGTAYYFGIRAKNSEGEYSKEIFCSKDAYLLRYVTLTEIPDSEPSKLTVQGCGGNCTWNSCFIPNPTSEFCTPFDKRARDRIGSEIDTTLPSVCPTDALYEFAANDSIANSGKIPINIDKDKCINCGRCVGQCYVNGGYGSVTTEVIKAISRLF